MKKIIEEEFEPYPDALTFDDWSQFMLKCKDITNPDHNQACEIVGINPNFYEKVIGNAFESWRDSTSRSILHAISYLKLGQTPQKGKAVFINLLWQTRFFVICKKISPFFAYAKKLTKDNKPIIIKNTQALGVTEGLITPANNILRCLYLYWWLNHITKVKLPKKIYRGIRAHDLFNHETLSSLISVVYASDKTHSMKRKTAIDVLIKWICDKKLHLITDGNILSFTASIPVAKYFSNNNGFVLAVDPSKVDIISSELHDERMQGKDFVSGKNEREYIIRIPEDYSFKPEDIMINDLEYFVAEENPLSVNLFDHDDKEAYYEMNGLQIKAWFSWKTNDSGRLLFMALNAYPYYPLSKKEFIEKHGFDPLPTEKNLNQITNFTIKPRRNY